PKVLGQKMLVNNYPMEIVGVSAAGFHGIDPVRSPQIRIPIQMKPAVTPGWDGMGDRRSQWINMFARLKPGYTPDSAKASTQGLLNQILRDELTRKEMAKTTKYNRDLFLKRQIRLVPAATGYSGMRERFSTALIVLMCMVGLVLLIACSNVANLLLARAVSRQKEIAVRLAIGASRRQLMQQLLTESLLLSLAGGILGIGFSVWTIKGLLSFLPGDSVTMTLRSTPDGRILLFNAVLVVVTTLLFGLAPALQALRVSLWNTLKDVAGAVAAPAGSVWMRKALVVWQVTLSFLLLAGSGLFVRSLYNLRSVDTGFNDLGRLVTFEINPALNGYDVPRLRSLYRQLLDNVRALPGVRSASFASVGVLRGDEWDSSMSVEGHTAKDGEDMQAYMNALAPGYFKTMGVPLLEGRDFDSRDEGETTAKVAIVNRKFAKHFFGERTAVGRHLGFGVSPETKLDIEIVGVVEDHLYEGPREGVRRQVFVPLLQGKFPSSATFYVRGSLPPAAMYAALRQQVARLDANIPVYEVKNLETQLEETLATERLIAILSAAFGALATILAAIGLYGVMAFVVARRTKEIGLRMALGAPVGAVRWLVMREVLLLLGIGLALGAPMSWALSSYVSSQLFGVPPADWVSAGAALSLLTAVAVLAGFIPAVRASQVDPIMALRYE
ncbi:MAG TPA: ABC transporter permease, partial [Bryobacteraceae bacterium]|nr:ABC transporter permease [Bryobacteraceae bacterium]